MRKINVIFTPHLYYFLYSPFSPLQIHISVFCGFSSLKGYFFWTQNSKFIGLPLSTLNIPPLPFIYLYLGYATGFCRNLVSSVGIEPRTLAIKAQTTNHWITRELPRYPMFIASLILKITQKLLVFIFLPVYVSSFSSYF